VGTRVTTSTSRPSLTPRACLPEPPVRLLRGHGIAGLFLPVLRERGAQRVGSLGDIEQRLDPSRSVPLEQGFGVIELRGRHAMPPDVPMAATIAERIYAFKEYIAMILCVIGI
jgi:hypothetical protein